MKDVFQVRPCEGPVNIDVRVPGSKSMTNRALLLAALAEGESILRGVGMSDDSRVFMEALIALGFDLTEKYEADGSISIRVIGHGGALPQKKAKVYVGSAGTAARFLTAMTALSDGEYEVSSSDQMKARPMRELLEALELLGARFTYHEEPYAFPFTVRGRNYIEENTSAEREEASPESAMQGETSDQPIPVIPLNIDRSSQFLSALLLCAPMIPEGCTIHLTGTRSARSYVEITERMMIQFGYNPPQRSEVANKVLTEQRCDIDPQNTYSVAPNSSYSARDYAIEPDASAACYFYAMAAACTGTARVRGMTRANTQGDMRFLDVLSQMGCTVSEIKSEDADNGELLVTRAPESPLHGIDIDMSDFSDQTMTLAAIAPFADSPTTITGVAHIRGQESNRIEAIVTELNRLGIECEEREDGVRIQPLEKEKQNGGERTDSGNDHPAEDVLVRTYNDHRMAMAFAVTGLHLPGVSIDNPACCRKTFDNYFEILSGIR